ncbi:MAG: spermidine synthase [Actinomycetia bacterium]|nr:spermidine synthase [Actinomycetes bacterium]
MRRQRLELVAASFLMLFVELVAIRWSGAWVVHLSYFANFVLLGSFLGIGIGFLRAHKGPDLFAWSPVVIALFLGLVAAFPAQIDRTGGDLVFFGVRQTGLPAWVLLPLVFCATAASLATVAHGVAVRFQRFPPLEAYRLDILGSILGIVAFSVLAFTGTGSIGWGVVIVATSLWLLGKPSPLQLVALVSLLAVLALGTFSDETIWSPYYRLRLGHAEGLVAVDANGVPHQAAVRTQGTDYELPYDRIATAPDRVLVVGAGNGNDVAVALRQGASRVDAVEIDPKLMEIGERFHPEQPYADPRVRQFVDDGRAFLERTDHRYGLIVFALPDSLTLLSGQSAVRLESYLFTREAFQAAAEHLEPQGAFTIYNFYREQWLADRLAGTLTEVFGERPCFDLGESRGLGEVGRLSVFVASADPETLRCEERWDPQDRSVVAPAVDDRPFLYLQERSIPPRYLVALALVLLASVVFIRIGGGSFRPMFRYADLFFMGAAFLLLETKSVVQFALLFGTTWLVNSLVFVGVLLSVLLAIEVERRIRIARPGLLLGVLFLGLSVAWLIPTGSLLGLPIVPRLLAAIAISFFPIFVANLIFAERFRDTEDPTSWLRGRRPGRRASNSYRTRAQPDPRQVTRTRRESSGARPQGSLEATNRRRPVAAEPTQGEGLLAVLENNTGWRRIAGDVNGVVYSATSLR